ncbi:MAG TPA: NAD-dependent epimerase/dehydratase family protein [Chthonomonadaceae bacterium]|nr:NAD-dependent epimerase/dehydratase family protein [Chthonomonadaceae bacterium]
MRIAVTGARGRLARGVIASLAREHKLRAVDSRFEAALPDGVEALAGDIRDRDFAATVTDGVDAILHLAPLDAADMDDATIVDTFSRGSFNLADMAIEQGVRRFIVGSSLEMFARYPAGWRVDEGWRPRPYPVPAQLACWLAEQSMRECCHTAPIRALALRFGQIVTDDEIAGRPFDPRWLHIDDAVQAVRRALDRVADVPPVGDWNIYHISSGDRARIRPHRARSERFGYKPAHDFADHDSASVSSGTADTAGSAGSDSGPAGASGSVDPGRAASGAHGPDPGSAASANAGSSYGSVGVRRAGQTAEGRDASANDADAAGPDWRAAIGQPARPPSHRAARAGGSRPRVVIFGSAGPVAAALAEELKEAYLLRQTDLRPLAEVRAANRPQSEGAPLPISLPPPHEERVVDVRDYAQVLAACEGMDAIANCTVLRPDYVQAFLVNTLGAYNVVKAAAALGIRRVVHTGPQQYAMDERTGYWWDYEVTGDAPARPGRNLYAHSKFLGNEICRIYAEEYGLEIPTLLYTQFLNPELTRGLASMAVSWQDSARALRAALEAPLAPGSYEEVIITNDLPHGRFSPRRAKDLLGWTAQDDLSHLWQERR